MAGNADVPIAMQTPGEARDFASADKLALFKVNRVHGDHARMALRHLIRFRWVEYYG